MSRTAVVLLNLGGPDRLSAVEPYLRNLFGDPAIIGLPGPLRWLLARGIAFQRAKFARGIYAKIGGGSPLLAETQAQAAALTAALATALESVGGEVRVFIAMRYWHPRAAETIKAVCAFNPDDIVLLPLYPHYSTTTTGSSLGEWKHLAAKAGLTARTHAICCYPTEPGLIAAQSEAIRAALASAARSGVPRLLFSAHGLPKKVIAAGDPYQWQVERTAAAIVAGLGEPAPDWVVCYQSRVGPLEWLGPATLDVLRQAGADRRPVVVVPIAFVSEHSETLVELDIDYRERALVAGVPAFVRVPAVGTAPAFIAGLARLVAAALRYDGIMAGDDETRCPVAYCRCGRGQESA